MKPVSHCCHPSFLGVLLRPLGLLELSLGLRLHEHPPHPVWAPTAHVWACCSVDAFLTLLVSWFPTRGCLSLKFLLTLPGSDTLLLSSWINAPPYEDAILTLPYLITCSVRKIRGEGVWYFMPFSKIYTLLLVFLFNS